MVSMIHTLFKMLLLNIPVLIHIDIYNPFGIFYCFGFIFVSIKDGPQ